MSDISPAAPGAGGLVARSDRPELQVHVSVFPGHRCRLVWPGPPSVMADHGQVGEVPGDMIDQHRPLKFQRPVRGEIDARVEAYRDPKLCALRVDRVATAIHRRDPEKPWFEDDPFQAQFVDRAVDLPD